MDSERFQWNVSSIRENNGFICGMKCFGDFGSKIKKYHKKVTDCRGIDSNKYYVINMSCYISKVFKTTGFWLIDDEYPKGRKHFGPIGDFK